GRGDVARDEPVAPGAQRHARDERREGLEERGTRQRDRARAIETLRPRPRGPVEAWHRRRELVKREPGVRRIGRLVPLRPRDRGFEREYFARRIGRRVAP